MAGYPCEIKKIANKPFQIIHDDTDLSQFYRIENKKISDENFSGTYGRIFPMSGIYFETPIINRINNLYILPKISLVINGSQPSSVKVSNEESTNNSYSLLNLHN